MKVTDLINAITNIEDDRLIKKEIIISALAEGLEKAYRKHINCPDASVRVDISENDEIHLYQQKTVVEEVDDDEIELSLEDALEKNPNAQLGDVIEEETSIEEFGRSSVTLVKNVMLQKIKEASKQVVYDEYIDRVSDLVNVVVETVEDKFVLVRLDKVLALMSKNEQIPGEKYYDGQRLKVVIKSVSKETKGAQVLVSRASANLVKRLFEQQVTEIFDGTVEIKAIAREANERTKMAVYSHNPNVDAIGACIGNRGARVVSIINEITQPNNPATHENIDIVEWSDDFIEYVKNCLKPAVVSAVVPNEDGTVLVVVEDNQLSLAIGKKGVNAKLAVKLLNKKIDIKTVSAANELGIDYMSMMAEYKAKEDARKKAEEAERLLRKAEKEAEEKAKAEAEALRLEQEREALEAEKAVQNEATEVEVINEVADVNNEVKVAVEETVNEIKDEEVEEVVKRRKPKLVAKANEYVSKFEDLADAKKEEKGTSTRKKKANKEDEEAKEIKEKLEELKKMEYEIKPEYTDEEIDEFENAEDDHWYDEDVDYDQYEDFYDK